MFTDIVGSTEMTVRLGDRMAVELVRAHDALVRRALAPCGGREVKHTGDGIMAAFDEAVAAAAHPRSDVMDAGQRLLKGFKEPVRLFRVAWRGGMEPAPAQ